MLPRSVVVAKQIYKSATKTRLCDVNYVVKRELNSAQGSVHFVANSNCKPFVRSLVWSSNVLCAKKSPENAENVDKSSQTKATQQQQQQKPIVKIVVADAKEGESEEIKAADVKIVLDNIKEQSLNEEKTETNATADTLKQIKGKIFDRKSKEVEQEKAPPVKKDRKKLDLTQSSLERNFITPIRAMSEFLLKPSDLESLPKTKRRSPFEHEQPITVFWRRDVEAKACEMWGSKENLVKELRRQEIERKQYQQSMFTIKRRMRDYKRELTRTAQTAVEKEGGLKGRSGRVVLIAVVINGTNCLFKLFAWLYTGSHSMFSECIHSFADTINQLILAYGIHKSVQIADSDHPYGYTNMKYVASLISGVGIFCVGTGLSLYHGVTGLVNPQPIEDFFWAYFILGGSLVSEGATWLVAFNSIRKGAKETNMSVREYIFRSQDPSVNVVLLEDFAAVVGVAVAAVCMGLSAFYQTPIPDAVGSLLVGCILGTVASFIIYSNVAALVGRSISEEQLSKINSVVESDVMVRAIYDVKGIDMGNYLIRYKAEIDFDGRELTRAYLDKLDMEALHAEITSIKYPEETEQFMLKHGEAIIDTMGAEIDRIEMKLKKAHPEIRHCDLEIL